MRKLLLLRIAALCCCGVLLTSCASSLIGWGLASPRTPEKIRKETVRNRDRWEALMPGLMHWADSLRDSGVMRDTVMEVEGCRLHAMYAPAGPCRNAEGPGNSTAIQPRHTAIVVHGYNAGPYNVMMLARMYRDSLGFNVLMPSLRHHYRSEGEYTQMGWKDRLDLLKWSEFAHGVFNDTLQVFHGESMGAAAVMMASGEETQDYVRGFIEDCGYTSAWEEIVFAAGKYLHRDSLFVRRAAELSDRRYGVNLYEASSVAQLAKCAKPMMFIHGGADQLVPVRMAWENYNAKVNGYREIWIAPGSAHSRSFPDYPGEYTARVRAFLMNHVLNGDSL